MIRGNIELLVYAICGLISVVCLLAWYIILPTYEMYKQEHEVFMFEYSDSYDYLQLEDNYTKLQGEYTVLENSIEPTKKELELCEATKDSLWSNMNIFGWLVAFLLGVSICLYIAVKVLLIPAWDEIEKLKKGGR